MRQFFRRKSSSDTSRAPNRRLSAALLLEIEVLHLSQRPTWDEDILPTATGRNDENADAESVALSETETLAYTKQQRMDLQDTFNDNYTAYLPFVLRRLRREHAASVDQEASYAAEQMARAQYASDLDDEKTVALGQDTEQYIMQRETSRYNYKRLLVVALELIRSTTYVFPDAESFKIFRYLRANNKKLRKNSMIVYEPNGVIKRIKGRGSVSELDKPTEPVDGVVDQRHHVVPLEYKLKGSGLPLFKITVPYMSSFRKKVPYMVFKRYKEVPAPPPLLLKEAEDDEKFEMYEYCDVHMKTFQQYKRYTLHFTPADAAEFKVVAFQNNYRPFTDFVYKGTRFRVVGSSLVTAYLMNYNPELKLIVIDDDQPALCDNLVNKKLSSSRRGNRAKLELPRPAEELVNPVPRSDNKILLEDEGGFMQVGKKNYIPNNMPPFGRFLDSCVYPIEQLLLPKKYSEVGKMELYQALEGTNHADMSSTLLVDVDQLVLTTVLLTLRETSLRTTNRYSNNSLVSRMGTLGAAPGLGISAGIGYLYTASM